MGDSTGRAETSPAPDASNVDFWTEANVHATVFLSGSDNKQVRDFDDISLSGKQDVAYLVSSGAQLSANLPHLYKASTNGTFTVDEVLTPLFGVVNGAQLTILNGFLGTSDLPGQLGFVGGNDSVLHIQHTMMQTLSRMAFGIVAADNAVVHARAVTLNNSNGWYDCAFTSIRNGEIHVNESNATSTGPLLCSFSGEPSLFLHSVEYTSTYWPALFLSNGPKVVVSNSKLTTDLDGSVLIYNGNDNSSSSTTELQVSDSILATARNGAVFYLNGRNTSIAFIRSEIFNEGSDLLWARCSATDPESCEDPVTVNVAIDTSTVRGDIVAWANASVTITIDAASTWLGSTSWSAETGPSVNVVVHGWWLLLRDTYVNQLIASRPNLGNIVSQGYTLFYNPDANPQLGGQEIQLNGGGMAKPFVHRPPATSAIATSVTPSLIVSQQPTSNMTGITVTSTSMTTEVSVLTPTSTRTHLVVVTPTVSMSVVPVTSTSVTTEVVTVTSTSVTTEVSTLILTSTQTQFVVVTSTSSIPVVTVNSTQVTTEMSTANLTLVMTELSTLTPTTSQTQIVVVTPTITLDNNFTTAPAVLANEAGEVEEVKEVQEVQEVQEVEVY